MIIGGASLNQTPLDWEGNKNNILAAIAEAKANQVAILCLPEMAICGYGCEDMFYAKWLETTCFDYLKEILPHTKGIAVNLGLPVWIAEKCYNCMAMLSDGELLGFVAKQNLANDGVHYEHRWFTPWLAFVETQFEFEGKSYPFGDITFSVKDKILAFEICEDAWLGSNRVGYRHLQRAQKPDIILNPNASHFAFGKYLQRIEQVALEGSRAFDCVFVLCNLLGNEGGKMIYDGDVLIAQKGKLLAKNKRLSFKNHDLLLTNIDFENEQLSEINIKEDVEGKEENFAQAVALALFDYCRKSKSKGFVLSLSGGADSATCSVMVSEMIKRGIEELGNELFVKKLGLSYSESTVDQKTIASQILTCAYQGTKNSSKETLQSASALAEEIGATFYEWEIDQQLEGYQSIIESKINRKLTWQQDDITLQNIQARSRSPIIWMLANINNALLLTTSNRSEGDVGYTTMDGDSSGSIAPIAGVDKPYIRSWLQWAENSLGYRSLKLTNSMAPTAELRPQGSSQTDESDLMPYELMVEIEQLAFVHRKDPVTIYMLLLEKLPYTKEELHLYIQRFFRLWARNQWKRERTAPSFHVDIMSVDPRSWLRFPILSGGFSKELQELEKLVQS